VASREFPFVLHWVFSWSTASEKFDFKSKKINRLPATVCINQYLVTTKSKTNEPGNSKRSKKINGRRYSRTSQCHRRHLLLLLAANMDRLGKDTLHRRIRFRRRLPAQYPFGRRCLFLVQFGLLIDWRVPGNWVAYACRLSFAACLYSNSKILLWPTKIKPPKQRQVLPFS